MGAFVSVVLCLAAPAAAAFDLDDFLPVDISGYGMPFGVTDINRLRRVDNSAGAQFGDVSLNPALDLDTGFDSAPNGTARGSAMFREMPSLLVGDPQLGLGGLIAATATQFPEAGRQDVSGVTVALGERAELPRETITVSGAYIRAQETGFALTTVALTRPLAFNVADIRASDAITAGLFTLKPDLSVTSYRFDGVSIQNRTDTREGLTTSYTPGGPGQLVFFLHAAQSRYDLSLFNTNTEEALLGVGDDETGLLNLRLLAGVAHRQGQSGQAQIGDLTTPVVEAGADWIPGDLDHVRLKLAREIDDPDEIDATPYTLTEASLSLTHEYLRDVTLDGSLRVAHADYAGSALRETLFSTDDGVEWQLNAALAVKADYTFNDRQANYLRAANEHVITLGLKWTP